MVNLDKRGTLANSQTKTCELMVNPDVDG